MIRWILQMGARAFGRKYHYDVSYMLDTIEASASGGLRLTLFPAVTRMSGTKAGAPVIAGAWLASSYDGDCGPCVQLSIDMAREAGIPAAPMRACLNGDTAAGGDVGLGFEFARAAIGANPGVHEIAAQIEARFGRKTLIAASFAAASGRFYPVYKRALGHGAACQKLDFGDGQEMLVTAHG